MIEFKRMNLWQRLWLKVNPSARARYHAELKAVMTYLCKHPEEACIIEGELILPE